MSVVQSRRLSVVCYRRMSVVHRRLSVICVRWLADIWFNILSGFYLRPVASKKFQSEKSLSQFFQTSARNYMQCQSKHTEHVFCTSQHQTPSSLGKSGGVGGVSMGVLP